MTVEKDSSKKRPKAIVLPLQPDPAEPFAGVGMAIHFLLGNVLAVHSGLSEFWFGWRVKKIFPERVDLIACIRSEGRVVDVQRLAVSQKIPLWFGGSLNGRKVSLEFTDKISRSEPHCKTLDLRNSDDLIGFRKDFIDWIGACNFPFKKEQVEMALWPEPDTDKGLDATGRALEAFYLYSAYGGKDRIDLAPFQAAVSLAPDSFMAQDLLGWAHYRNRNFRPAKEAFSMALQANPNGVGAMSGLMWCGVQTGDKEEACLWAVKKAQNRQEDTTTARHKALLLLDKYS